MQPSSYKLGATTHMMNEAIGSTPPPAYNLKYLQENVHMQSLGSLSAIHLSCPTTKLLDCTVKTFTTNLGGKEIAQGTYRLHSAPLIHYSICCIETQLFVLEQRQFPSPGLFYIADALWMKEKFLLQQGVLYTPKYISKIYQQPIKQDKGVLDTSTASETKKTEVPTFASIEFIGPGGLHVEICSLGETLISRQGNIQKICRHPLAVALQKSMLASNTPTYRKNKKKDTLHHHAFDEPLGLIVPIHTVFNMETNNCNIESAPIKIEEETSEKDEISDALELDHEFSELEQQLEKEVSQHEATISIDTSDITSSAVTATATATADVQSNNEAKGIEGASVETKTTNKSSDMTLKTLERDQHAIWADAYRKVQHQETKQDVIMSSLLWWKKLGFDMATRHNPPFDWSVASDAMTLLCLWDNSKENRNMLVAKPSIGFLSHNIYQSKQFVQGCVSEQLSNTSIVHTQQSHGLLLLGKVAQSHPIIIGGDSDPQFCRRILCTALLLLIAIAFIILALALWFSDQSWSIILTDIKEWWYNISTYWTSRQPYVDLATLCEPLFM